MQPTRYLGAVAESSQQTEAGITRENAAKMLRFARWTGGALAALTLVMIVVFGVLMLAKGEVAMTVLMVVSLGGTLGLGWWKLRVPYTEVKRAASQEP